MAQPKYTFAEIDKSHKAGKKQFDCGNEKVNDYLNKLAYQHHLKRVCEIRILSEAGSELPIGYYGITVQTFPVEDIPEDIQKSLGVPSKTSLRCGELAWFGVDKKHTGKGVGRLLWIDACRTFAKAAVNAAMIGLLVKPIDDEAVKFWKTREFRQLTDDPFDYWFIPTKTILQLLSETGIEIPN